MTLFELFLIEMGYIKFILNTKTFKYEKPKNHNISTMVNIDHRYFHHSDKIIEKIEQGLTVKNGITWDDRKGEIAFGLHEYGKPSTLITPRPSIEVKRIKNDMIVIENENYDDSMNIILKDVSNVDIFKAMYDKSIVLKIDLTIV